ncbi:hypothetical protein M758_3G143600 [Ceratodon purpureus]|nr:hypothetical protein M758_3G143600 [Ceratodon purpureus]
MHTTYVCLWRAGTHHRVIARVMLAIPFLRRRKRKPPVEGPRLFTFKELSKATKSFSDGAIVGSGGFGMVYKGTLSPSGAVVAVKRLKNRCGYWEKVLFAEASTVWRIRHPNLVRLQGWCDEKRQLLLVYDFMSNGSLDEWLFPCRRRNPADPKYKRFGPEFEALLPWSSRVSILAGVAAALEYLHVGWTQCVLHRDVKSSNVMLDAEMKPHLGDFGLARLTDHQKPAKTTKAAGTLSYMAPELPYTNKATKESDVYSFGILVLEVVCGKRPVNMHVEGFDEDFVLRHIVWRAHNSGDVLSAVDPTLLANVESSDERTRMKLLLHLGLWCCLPDPETRPPMKVVMQVITSQPGKNPLSTDLMPPLPSSRPKGRYPTSGMGGL